MTEEISLIDKMNRDVKDLQESLEESDEVMGLMADYITDLNNRVEKLEDRSGLI